MKRLIALWLAWLMLVAQPLQAAVCVGFGPAAGGCSAYEETAAWVNTLASASNTYIGNKFDLTAGVSVCQIDININRNGSETGKDYLIEIRADAAGLPSETVLGTSDTVSNSGVPTTLGWVAFTFGAPVALDASTFYWLVWRKVGGGTTYTSSMGATNGTPEAVYGSTTGLTGSWGVAISTTRTIEYKIYAQ